MQDPVYFIQHYVKVQHPKLGVIPFKLRPYQIRMIKGFQDNRYVVVLSARQTGKSVTAGAFLLWYACFHFDKTILIASNKNSNAMEMIHRIRLGYENLPLWLKPGIKEDGWNKHNIGFDNGTRIVSEATSESSGRGLAISLLYLDEFAHVAKNVQEEFWTSIEPTLSTGGSCIMTSTPNGDMDIFAQIWRGARVQRNGFLPIEVKWDEAPGRDAKFKEETIGRIGEQKWKQEYECNFLSAEGQLISALKLAEMQSYIEDMRPKFVVGDEGKEVIFWYDIKQGGTYLVGVDPSTGTGSDFTVIVVRGDNRSLKIIVSNFTICINNSKIIIIARNITLN